MEIAVLLKQVPDTETVIRVAEDGVSIKTDDVKWVINPYDEYAVEEALRIKEAHGGTVTVLSVGSRKTTEALRTALAMGADRAVLVQDPAAEGSGPLGTARIIAAALAGIPFDLVIAGQRAVDDDNYQVGAAVAEFLRIPQVSMVSKVELADGNVICHRFAEGLSLVTRSPLPMLFTTQKGLNEPRFASMMGIMKAKKKPLDIKTLAETGVDPSAVGAVGATTRVLSLRLPEERKGGRIIEGETVEEKAAALVRALHEERKLL